MMSDEPFKFDPDVPQKIGNRWMMLDKEHNPISLKRWGELKYRGDYHRIGEERIRLDDHLIAYVSTVWLGHDHSFGMGPPLIFETMVFIEPEWYTDEHVWRLYCERYTYEVEAFAGHARIVQAIKAGKSPEEMDAFVYTLRDSAGRVVGTQVAGEFLVEKVVFAVVAEGTATGIYLGDELVHTVNVTLPAGSAMTVSVDLTDPS